MKNLLLILLFLTVVTSCTTDNKIKYSNNSIKKISFLKDNNYTINQVNNLEFTPLKNYKLNHKNGTYWFKISISKFLKNNENLIFWVKEPSISSLSIYNSTNKITTKKSEKGSPNIIINIKNNNDLNYVIKADFKRQVHFPIEVFNANKFYKSQEKKNLGIGLYYCMAIMVFIINLIFYISLKDNTFLMYCLFLASINLAFTGFDGVLYLFFYQQYFDLFIIICHFLIQLFGVLFASKFLGLKEFYPKSNIIGIVVLLFPAGFYLLFFITNNFLLCAIADLLGLLVLAYYWVLGFLMIKKEEYAKFFVIGYSMILFFGIFFLIPLNFGISFFTVTFNQLKSGALFEMLVLTYAITYRVKKLHQENDIYRNELKDYLEEIYGLKEKLKFQENNELESTLIAKVNKLKENFNLTDREVDILLKITEGLSNNEIAEKLFISINTVKYHTKNLYEKLDIKKRGELSSKILVQ